MSERYNSQRITFRRSFPKPWFVQASYAHGMPLHIGLCVLCFLGDRMIQADGWRERSEGSSWMMNNNNNNNNNKETKHMDFWRFFNGWRDLKILSNVGVWKMTSYSLGMHHSLAQNWQNSWVQVRQKHSRNHLPWDRVSLLMEEIHCYAVMYRVSYISGGAGFLPSINCIFKTTYHFRMKRIPQKYHPKRGSVGQSRSSS